MARPCLFYRWKESPLGRDRRACVVVFNPLFFRTNWVVVISWPALMSFNSLTDLVNYSDVASVNLKYVQNERSTYAIHRRFPAVITTLIVP